MVQSCWTAVSLTLSVQLSPTISTPHPAHQEVVLKWRFYVLSFGRRNRAHYWCADFDICHDDKQLCRLRRSCYGDTRNRLICEYQVELYLLLRGLIDVADLKQHLFDELSPDWRCHVFSWCQLTYREQHIHAKYSKSRRYTSGHHRYSMTFRRSNQLLRSIRNLSSGC